MRMSECRIGFKAALKSDGSACTIIGPKEPNGYVRVRLANGICQPMKPGWLDHAREKPSAQIPTLDLRCVCSWIGKPFPAERIALTFDTGRDGTRRYFKSCAETFGERSFLLDGASWFDSRYGFTHCAGKWNVSELDFGAVIRIEAYAASYDNPYGKLLETFVRPGCEIPEATGAI